MLRASQWQLLLCCWLRGRCLAAPCLGEEEPAALVLHPLCIPLHCHQSWWPPTPVAALGGQVAFASNAMEGSMLCISAATGSDVLAAGARWLGHWRDATHCQPCSTKPLKPHHAVGTAMPCLLLTPLTPANKICCEGGEKVFGFCPPMTVVGCCMSGRAQLAPPHTLLLWWSAAAAATPPAKEAESLHTVQAFAGHEGAASVSSLRLAAPEPLCIAAAASAAPSGRLEQPLFRVPSQPTSQPVAAKATTQQQKLDD